MMSRCIKMVCNKSKLVVFKQYNGNFIVLIYKFWSGISSIFGTDLRLFQLQTLETLPSSVEISNSGQQWELQKKKLKSVLNW